MNAANAGHPKAFYQLAKLFQKGMGVPKDLATVSLFYLCKFIELLKLDLGMDCMDNHARCYLDTDLCMPVIT